MAGVAVVTDSTSYLPAELVERHGIHIVPLYIVFGGDRTVPETDITDYDAFFEELRAAEQPAHDLAAVGRRLHLRVRAAARGRRRGRVRPHLRRAVGHGRVGAARGRDARRARARAASACTCSTPRPPPGASGCGPGGGERGAAEGTPAAEIVGRLAEARGELRLWFAIDTLEFLRRGGRIGAASAWIGSTLRVKPILTVQNEMTPGGARAHQLARVRADGRLPAPVPRLRRGRLVRAAHQRARAPRAARSSAGSRSSAASRPWSARSARCSPRTRGRACSARAGSRSRFLP